MVLLKLFVILCILWGTCVARSLQSGQVPLSPEQEKRLASWTKEDKQNIWELSGQFEGDIVLNSKQRNGLLDIITRWHNREIPFEIDPIFSSEQKQWIVHSLTEYNNKTCIKPRPRLDTDEDYVYVTGNDTGCHSSVGKQGGRQIINLKLNKPGKGCLRLGTIVHEFLHALGFYHQQSASERDNFVEIIWKNIEKGLEYNFNKYSEDVVTSFGEKYDFNSVMHYSAYAFSKNNEKTIIPKDANVEIGQREGLSEIDAIKLNKMYKCH